MTHPIAWRSAVVNNLGKRGLLSGAYSGSGDSHDYAAAVADAWDDPELEIIGEACAPAQADLLDAAKALLPWLAEWKVTGSLATDLAAAVEQAEGGAS